MKVTVEKAIKKGTWFVNIPVFIIYASIFAVSFYAFHIKVISYWVLLLSFIYGIIPAWLYWSYAIVKWKIWAFKNVRNVHELKHSAFLNNLIWQDDSWFNKTEIWTKSQKKEWKTILKKFEKKDSYNHITIPKKTVIKHSQVTFWTANFLIILFIFCAIYFFNELSYFYTALFVIVSIVFIFDNKKRLKEKFVFIISDEGITSQKNGFITWKNVKSLKVTKTKFANSVTYYLKIVFYVTDEYFDDDIITSESIKIQDFSHTFTEINTLIENYKQRYHKNERTNH